MLFLALYKRSKLDSVEMMMQLVDVPTKTQVWRSLVHSSPNSMHFTIISPKKTYVASGLATAGAEAADVDLLDELWLIETEQLRKNAVLHKPLPLDENGTVIYPSDEEEQVSTFFGSDFLKFQKCILTQVS